MRPKEGSLTVMNRGVQRWTLPQLDIPQVVATILTGRSPSLGLVQGRAVAKKLRRLGIGVVGI